VTHTRRVVVTGIGLVSSLGIGTEPNWAALCAGQSGIAPITKFDAAQFATRIAGEVKDFDPLRFIEKKDVKKMDVFIQYAIAASQFAMDDSGFVITPELGPRVGVFIASGIGGFTTIEREHKALLEGGPRKISPFFIPSAIINLAAGQVSIRYGAKGPNSATCTACSASAHAIGDAFEIIRRGDADVMIAGGSEAAITPMGIGGFGALRALSTRNDEPERASRPFDKDRDGFVVGEGAGVLILEEFDLARRRGARGQPRDARRRHHRGVGALRLARERSRAAERPRGARRSQPEAGRRAAIGAAAGVRRQRRRARVAAGRGAAHVRGAVRPRGARAHRRPSRPRRRRAWRHASGADEADDSPGNFDMRRISVGPSVQTRAHVVALRAGFKTLQF